MIVTPLKTQRITPGKLSLIDLLDEALAELSEKAILVITSKVVSLCENSVRPKGSVNKEELVMQEADQIAEAVGEYGFHFTITNNTLIPSAGIDESNSDDTYVLWPRDAQATANETRSYILRRFSLQQVGVIITDSTITPLRRGTTGIALAHSGFRALNNYVGTPDLFGRPFTVSQANVAGGLAAAAVLSMGEGAEQTPLCIIQDLPFVHFQHHHPTAEELRLLAIEPQEDVFAPFLTSVKWLPKKEK